MALTLFAFFNCINFVFSNESIVSNSFLINFVFCLLIASINLILYIKLKKEVHFSLFLGFTLFASAHLFISIGNFNQAGIFIFLSLLFGYLLTISSLISLIKQKILIDIAKALSNTKLQISLIVISLFLLILMFYFPSLKFNSKDPKPIIHPIKPIASKELIVEVETGLFIKNFSEFNVIENLFEINGIVWFEFNPHQISLDLIEQFSFEKGTIIKKSKPEIKIINEKLLARYKIKVRFKTDLNYQYFPLEDHNLYLVLTNSHLNPKEIVLTSLNTDLTSAKNISTRDWQLINSEVNYGYIESLVDEETPLKNTAYPAACFNLFFTKIGIKNLLIIFIPLFVAFFLGLFSLMLEDINKKGILSLSVGSLTLLVFNLSVIEKLTPKTSYFCLSDSIFTLILTSVFIMLLVNIAVIKQTSIKIFEKIRLLKSYIFLCFLILILTSVYYLLY